MESKKVGERISRILIETVNVDGTPFDPSKYPNPEAIQEVLKSGRIKTKQRIEKKPRYEWHFTEDEKKALQSAFSDKKITKGVSEFIEIAESLCQSQMLLQNQPKPEVVDREAEKILKGLKDVFSSVELLRHGEIRLARYKRMPGRRDPYNIETLNFNRKVSDMASITILPLRNLIKIIEGRPGVKHSRRGAPGNISGFEQNILKVYRNTIGEPKTKKLFSDILNILREGLNRPFSDIRRTLEKIL